MILLAAIPLLSSCSESTEKPSSDKLAKSTTPLWLAERGRQEAQLAGKSAVLHDFKFTDKRQESGITFQNQMVDDAGKDYKLATGNPGICRRATYRFTSGSAVRTMRGRSRSPGHRAGDRLWRDRSNPARSSRSTRSRTRCFVQRSPPVESRRAGGAANSSHPSARSARFLRVSADAQARRARWPQSPPTGLGRTRISSEFPSRATPLPRASADRFCG